MQINVPLHQVKYRTCSDSPAMNGVPAKMLVRISLMANEDLGGSLGAIQLLPKAFSSGNFSPFLSAFSLSPFASFAVRNRRGGATPSTATKNMFWGLIFPKR